MNTGKEKSIAQEFRELWATAEEIAQRDLETYPLKKNEYKRDRVVNHFIEMLEMYSVKYGNPEQRLEIVEFLEKQLFRKTPVEDEVCHLTKDMWQDLRKAILAGEYRNLNQTNKRRWQMRTKKEAPRDNVVKLNDRETRGIGEQRWQKKHIKKYVLTLLACLAFLLASLTIPIPWLKYTVSGSIACGFLVWFFWFYRRASKEGRIFLEKVKAGDAKNAD